MALMSKPIATNPELLALIEKSKACWEAMSPEQKRAMRDAQRRSWVRGELMLQYEDMTAEQADALIDQFI